MESLGPYNLIIIGSIIIILSFLFNAFSERTNIPAVILLIGTGILLQEGMKMLNIAEMDFFPILEVVGIVGLIMIVLEAALDLELRRDKIKVITISFIVAFVGLIASTFACAAILYYLVGDMSWSVSLLYATPLSILSSAIIIPSVSNLLLEKKEFHVYESAFSDILGIMQFYFIQGLLEATDSQAAVKDFGVSLLLTVIISVVASYLLIILFQNIKSHVKLFLLIAILLLLYAVGKNFLHLSSLVIILMFGLVLSNYKVFFPGRFRAVLKETTVEHILKDLHVLTIETAFVVRTLFFVIFGLTITLASLWNFKVLQVSLAILASIYAVRFVLLRIFVGKDLNPQLYIAPRGLITVLLFFVIPSEFQLAHFEPGILLFIIIATSIIMTFALIRDGRARAADEAANKLEEYTLDPQSIYQGFLAGNGAKRSPVEESDTSGS